MEKFGVNIFSVLALPKEEARKRLMELLGLVKPNAKYEEIQKAFKVFIPWEEGERTGGLLWLLAKYTCRVQNPKCHECPIVELCDYGGMEKTRRQKYHRILSRD